MRRPLISPEAGVAVRAGDRHLADARSGWVDRASLAPVRRVRIGDRVGADRLISAADLHAARGRGGGPDRHGLAGEGLRGLCQRQRAAGRDCVPGRARRREVGTGPAHQPVHGEPVRPIVARTCLQHRHHGRAHCAGVSEQHRARRRAVSDRAVGRERAPDRTATIPRAADWAAI